MTASILSIRTPEVIEQAAERIRAGEILVLPTDTIYGLAALPNAANIKKLYNIREREQEPALPFLLAGPDYVEKLARSNRTATRLARHFWPGALTLILPPGPHLAPELRSLPIALRVPNYPPLIPLLKAVGGYLVVTGAVRSGYPPAITAQEAANLFGEKISLILDGGQAPFGIPSTIIDCVPHPPNILRCGAIPEDKILTALKRGPKGLETRA